VEVVGDFYDLFEPTGTAVMGDVVVGGREVDRAGPLHHPHREECPSLASTAFAGLCATAVHERTTVSASSAGTDEALTDDPIEENYPMERTLERSAGASASGTVIMARSSKPPGSFTSRETRVAQYR
jgi:hypothetical protein